MSTENEGAAVPSEAKPPTGPRPDSASASASGARTPGVPSAAPPPPEFAPTVTSAAGAGFDEPGRMPPYSDGRHPQPGYGHPGDAPADDRTSQFPTYAAAGPGAGAGGWGQQPPYGGGGDPWGTTGSPAPKRRNGGLIAAVLVAALVAGGIGGGIGFWAAGQSDSDSTTVSASGDPGALNRKPTSVSGIAQKALPSVVTIEAQGAGGDGGTGTGFIYDKQGHILTNNHVVASAADGGKLTATFSNGKKYDAEVVGRAQGYDVAVIKLKNTSGAPLNPLPLGKSSNVQVGDATIAIGAPFGLSGTVTTGIISAKDRPVASSDGGGTSASYMSALQTDASINPGNSGGPLMDAAGNVIGINSAIQSAGNGGGLGGESQQSGSIGLGFAIPIDQARRVAQDLIKTGKPVYPQIGVQVGMRDTGNGATIARTGNNGSDSVTPNGPADKAGLKPGDTITKLDDTVVDSGPTLISEIWQHKPGDQVTLTYKRGGKEHTTQVTLGQRTGDK
ncbi:trypsin-like peptidase domain-containing protein [Streptomyces sp. DSM 41527]|uniref:Trypsin-like peptidase domain-containing protein n=1 Tax=Streptomyces mooreae TaxID=3075523 RepID=A0ABU2T2V7_9ACTN|nr:trypsin-like peptidase domain-containing protein [Streptomyces sp. DSM 41527]MDT0455552.1 trypsin-like peptidase domain-containing protein [Streptomyces sp. DSM 41527]